MPSPVWGRRVHRTLHPGPGQGGWACISLSPLWVALVVKNLPTNAGDIDAGSIPTLGRSPWRMKWQPIPIFLFLSGKIPWTEEPGSYSPWGLRVWPDWSNLARLGYRGLTPLPFSRGTPVHPCQAPWGWATRPWRSVVRFSHTHGLSPRCWRDERTDASRGPASSSSGEPTSAMPGI